MIITEVRSRRVARAEFARLWLSDIDHMFSSIGISGNGRSCYRKNGEMNYLGRLNAIPAEHIGDCSGRERVDRGAWVWAKPQLRIEFRYLQKNATFWGTFCRDERRLSSLQESAIPYQSLIVFNIHDAFIQRAFPTLIDFWRRIEVPHGYGSELQFVFT